MSAIVGIVDRDSGDVVIAGDSAGVGADGSIEIRRDPKVFALGNLIFGCAGSYRPAQALRHRLIIPRRTRGVDAGAYVATSLIDAMSAAIAAAPAHADVGEEQSDFLVGLDGRLFRVDSEWGVAECATGFDAIGSGGDAALAALHAQDIVRTNARRSKRELPYSAETRAMDALCVAERVTNGVRKPFLVVRSAPPRKGHS